MEEWKVWGKGMEKTKWVKKNGEGEKEAAATWLRDNQRLRSRKGDRERRKRDLKRETKEDREKDSSLRERYRGEACPRPESLRIVFDAAHSLVCSSTLSWSVFSCDVETGDAGTPPTSG